MNNEFCLLNEGVVKQYLEHLVSENRLAEAPFLLFGAINKELHHIVTNFGSPLQSEADSWLTPYARLNPSDEQIRRALDAVMDEPARHGKRSFLFYSSRQWLAIFKVLCFLNRMNDGYGCMAHMEKYIKTLYQDKEPRVPCVQDSLTKKNVDRPFAGDLYAWERNKDQHQMNDYWPICKLFLEKLYHGC